MSVPMTANEIKIVLEKHAKYLRGESGGERANLAGADLAGADLAGADLAGADLAGADLAGAYLTRANLTGAYLTRANLTGAYLTGANLTDAYLTRANLTRANLTDANLTRANLAGAYLTDATGLEARSIVPEVGSFRAFKKLADGTIAEVEIPAEAKRTSSYVGRKCRAEFVRVVSGTGVSWHDDKTLYMPDAVVTADSFDPDPRIECSHGIHFFLTRAEAESYNWT